MTEGFMKSIFILPDQMLEDQIRSMRSSAPYALDYHYDNYFNAHSGIRFDWQNGEKINTVDHIRRLQVIKFELVAYLNWLGRIFHFVENMKRKGWQNLIFIDDFKIFRDKWASHRSVDDPKKGDFTKDDFLHYQILINLDTSQTFNLHGEYEPQLFIDGKEVSFNLFKRHNEIKKELEKIFFDLEMPPPKKKEFIIF